MGRHALHKAITVAGGVILFHGVLAFSQPSGTVPLRLVKGFGAVNSWEYVVDGALWEDPTSVTYLRGPAVPWALFEVLGDGDQPVLVDGFDICVRADQLMERHAVIPRRFKLYVGTDSTHLTLVAWDSVVYTHKPLSPRYRFDPVWAKYVRLEVTPPRPGTWETSVYITEIALYRSAGPRVAREQLRTGYVGLQYEDTLRLNSEPGQFILQAVDLPEGLDLDPVSGRIFGTPLEPFDGEFQVNVLSSHGREVGSITVRMKVEKPPYYLLGIQPGRQGVGIYELLEPPLGITLSQFLTIQSIGTVKELSASPLFAAVGLAGTEGVAVLDVPTRSLRYEEKTPTRGVLTFGGDEWVAFQTAGLTDLNVAPMAGGPCRARKLVPSNLASFSAWPGGGGELFALLGDGELLRMVSQDGCSFSDPDVWLRPSAVFSQLAVTKGGVWMATFQERDNRLGYKPRSGSRDIFVERGLGFIPEILLAHPTHETIYGVRLDPSARKTTVLWAAYYSESGDSIRMVERDAGGRILDAAVSPGLSHLIVLTEDTLYASKRYLRAYELDGRGLPVEEHPVSVSGVPPEGFERIETASAVLKPAVFSVTEASGVPGDPAQIEVRMDTDYPISAISFTLRPEYAWFDVDSITIVKGKSYPSYLNVNKTAILLVNPLFDDFEVRAVPLGGSAIQITLDRYVNPMNPAPPVSMTEDKSVCVLVTKVNGFAHYRDTIWVSVDDAQAIVEGVDRSARELPIVVKDGRFKLGGYSRGDLDRDGDIDLLDLKLCSDVLLSTDSALTALESIRADVNMNGRPDIGDLAAIRNEILRPSLPWPPDPLLPKRTPHPGGSRSTSLVLTFHGSAKPLDVALVCLRLQDGISKVSSLEPWHGIKGAWTYGKSLGPSDFAVVAVSDGNGLGNPQRPFRLVLELDGAAKEVPGGLQVLRTEALDVAGERAEFRVEVERLDVSEIEVGNKRAGLPFRKEGIFPSPNPFNQTVRFHYCVHDGGHVEIVVYNVKGQRVRTLYSGAVESGEHDVLWDGRGDDGHTMPSGIYVAILKHGGRSYSTKILLQR